MCHAKAQSRKEEPIGFLCGLCASAGDDGCEFFTAYEKVVPANA
jgi:hypothetical protein